MKRFLLGKHGRNWDDAPLPGVGLRDLDGITLEEFRRRGIASGRLPADTASDSAGDLIQMLHLHEGDYLRRAAVLLFHPVPARFFAGAFVKIGYFRTETELVYQDVIEGDLFAQVDRTVDLLRTKYSKAEITYEDIYRRETPLAPGEALREAVLNAIAHRDIVRTCRAAGTAEPRWELESGGLRLEFVFVGTVNQSLAGAARGSGGPARQAGGAGPPRPESQPESLAARVLRPRVFTPFQPSR